MKAPTAEPIPFTTTRFRCPFCGRGAAKKSRCREHIARCWKNPAARGCKTCKHYDRGGWQPVEIPGVLACREEPERCAVGVDLTGHGDPSEHTGDSLKVSRAKADGNSAITMVIPDAFITYPDLRKLVNNNPKARPVSRLLLAADCLAHFAKVRPRGELKLRFCGDNKPVIATIGGRFTGAVMPIRENTKLAAAPKPEPAQPELVGGGD